MKSRFGPDSQDPFDGAFNPAWDNSNFLNFLPPAGHNGESLFAAAPSIVPIPALSNEAVEAEESERREREKREQHDESGDVLFVGGSAHRLSRNAREPPGCVIRLRARP